MNIKAMCNLIKHEPFVVKNIVNSIYKPECVYIRNRKTFVQTIEMKKLKVIDTKFWNPAMGFFEGTQVESLSPTHAYITYNIVFCEHSATIKVKTAEGWKEIDKITKRVIITPFN